jgi:hypothetical protein
MIYLTINYLATSTNHIIAFVANGINKLTFTNNAFAYGYDGKKAKICLRKDFGNNLHCFFRGFYLHYLVYFPHSALLDKLTGYCTSSQFGNGLGIDLAQ